MALASDLSRRGLAERDGLLLAAAAQLVTLLTPRGTPEVPARPIPQERASRSEARRQSPELRKLLADVAAAVGSDVPPPTDPTPED
jgi:hypothetical protein